MTATIDYWQIKQKGIVGILGADTALALDYLLRLHGSSNPNVVRDPANADDVAFFAGNRNHARGPYHHGTRSVHQPPCPKP